MLNLPRVIEIVIGCLVGSLAAMATNNNNNRLPK